MSAQFLATMGVMMALVGAGLLLVATFVSAYLITGQVRGYANSRLLDIPNERSSHRQPTPRGGGLAIALSFCGAILLAALAGWLNWHLILGLGLAGSVVAGIGFWDDHGHISARWRMLAHLLTAGWAVFWLADGGELSIHGHTVLSGWPFGLAGCLFIAWMLNLFNFMDGIDGIAGAETAFVSLAAATLIIATKGPGQQALIPGLLGAATLGFLIWNWPPARIFMGDVGSGFVGFVLGATALSSAASHSLSLIVWLILAGVFLVDASFTLLRRMIDGQRWYEAHRSHAFQHAASSLSSHRRVTMGVILINVVWLLPLATAAAKLPQLEGWILIIAYAPLFALAFRWDAGKVITG